MSNKSDKTLREEQALNRALAWFGCAAVVEALTLLVKRFYVDFYGGEAGIAQFLLRMFPILAVVSALVCAGCVFWMIRNAKNEEKNRLPAVVAVITAVVAVCSTVFAVFVGDGVRAMLVLVPVVAVLALIYYLYQKEFFVVAVSGAAALIALWWMRQTIWTMKIYLLAVVALVVIVLCMAFVLFLKKSEGVLTVAGKRIRVFSKSANYAAMLVACALMAVLVVAALLLGPTVAYYLMFGVVALLFVMAVYYTVKLM